MTELARIIGIMKETLRQEILKTHRADSCIASTRAVTRVLAHFGFKSEVMPVSALVYNKPFIDAIMAKDAPPAESGPEFIQWCERTGAWSVGIGVNAPGLKDLGGNAGYPGHLVAVVRSGSVGMIIDASIDQANRESKGISLPSFLISPCGNFIDAPWGVTQGVSMRCTQYVSLPNGVRIEYRPIWKPRSWRASPDWWDRSRTDGAVKATIAHIERTA